MSDAISDEFLENLESILDGHNQIPLLRALKADMPSLSEKLFTSLCKGQFWNSIWLEKFEKVLLKLEEKLDIKEKDIEVFATVAAVAENYEAKNEKDYGEEGEEESQEEITPEEEASKIIHSLKKLTQEYIEDLNNLKSYLGFLQDVFRSVRKIKGILSNNGYDTLNFSKNKILESRMNKKELSHDALTAFLIKIWSFEMNTITDTREHIGLYENLINLRETRSKLKTFNSIPDSQKLIQFLDFLIWKHEIDSSREDEISFQELLKNTPKCLDLYEVTFFHKVADELEKKIYFEGLSKKDAKKQLLRELSKTSLSEALKKESVKSIADFGWEKSICIARYIKDFVGYSDKGDKLIQNIIEFIRSENSTQNEHDLLFREKNILYIENFHLSFLIDHYYQGSTNKELEDKIESTYDTDENDSNHPSYFREYKLGVYYYLKAKNLNKTLAESEKVIRQSEKRLNRARQLYMEMGRFTYPCFAGFNLSFCPKVFSLSTFIRHTVETDLQHIEKNLHKLSILEDEKDHIKEVRETLRDEQKSNLKRTVEVLAIFSALVIFSSSSIRLYEGIESLKMAVAFTVFFACSLCIFGFLIYAITRLDNKKRTPQIMFGFLVFIAIITGCYLWFGSDFDLSGEQRQSLTIGFHDLFESVES